MKEEQVSPAEHVEVIEEGNLVWTEHAKPNEAVEVWSEPLLSGEESDDLQSRWSSIQTEFVDEPRAAVEQADALVVEALEKISMVLSEKRKILDEQWINAGEVSTEDLRIALQRYRNFFNHLLTL